MTPSALRQFSLFTLSLGIAACGAGNGSAPLLPTSPEVEPASGVAAPGSSPEILMPVTSQGVQPEGFKAVFRVHPKPDTDGIIHGYSPFTVQFDVCGSRTDADKTLSYLYDWDFDHRPNVVGTGEACRQEHTYKVRPVPGGKGDVLFETNVCVVSGDPRVPGPDTFFSCRIFRISVPVPVAAPEPGPRPGPAPSPGGGVVATFNYSNAAAITTPTLGNASPYPSNIVVSLPPGTQVLSANVTLNNFSHLAPDDVDVLLVGPTLANAIILSDVGGFVDAVNVTLTLSDAAGSGLSTTSPPALASGTFRPTNFGAGDTFPAPAPVPTGSSTLGVFNGTDPNGTWSLYVVDDRASDLGSFAGGWSLELTVLLP